MLEPGNNTLASGGGARGRAWADIAEHAYRFVQRRAVLLVEHGVDEFRHLLRRLRSRGHAALLGAELIERLDLGQGRSDELAERCLQERDAASRTPGGADRKHHSSASLTP